MGDSLIFTSLSYQNADSTQKRFSLLNLKEFMFHILFLASITFLFGCVSAESGAFTNFTIVSARASAVLCSVVGGLSPGDAFLAVSIAVTQSVMQCQTGDDFADAPDMSTHPSTVVIPVGGVAASAAAGGYAGVLIVDVGIVMFITLAAWIFGRFNMTNLDASYLNFHVVPRHIHLYLLPSVVIAGLYMCFERSVPFGWRILGFTVVISFFLSTMHLSRGLPCVPDHALCAEAPPATTWFPLLGPRLIWKDLAGHTFCKWYAPLFKSFREERWWYFYVDLVFILALCPVGVGLMSCSPRAVYAASISVAHMTLLITLRPFHTRIDEGLAVVTISGQALALVLSAIRLSMNYNSSALENVASCSLFLVSIGAIGKTIISVTRKVDAFCHREPKDQRSAALEDTVVDEDTGTMSPLGITSCEMDNPWLDVTQEMVPSKKEVSSPASSVSLQRQASHPEVPGHDSQEDELMLPTLKHSRSVSL